MRSITRHAPAAARILFGLLFLVFGLNGFLHFIPMGGPPEHAKAFMTGLVSTGYMFPLIKGTEVVVGVMLLLNRFVPLALALIAPNVVNIVLFHAVLEPSGLPLGLAILAFELYLAWAYREAFRPMLAARVQPTIAPEGHHLIAHARG